MILVWSLAAADLAVGLVLVSSGTLVLLRHRERRIGALMLLTAATWFAGSLWASLVFLHRGPMVHLHLSYPTGWLRRWPAIAATAGAYVWAVAEGWYDEPSITAALAVAMAAAATDGYVRTKGPARKAGLPGFIAALLFAGVLSLSAVNVLFDLRADLPVALGYDGVMVFVTVWLTADLLRGRWTEATLADLVAQLGGAPEGVGVEADLRRALGDPGLTVGYWDPVDLRFLDPRGESVERGSGTITVDDDRGEPLAIMRHDPALATDPALIKGATAALRMVASNERLRGEIRRRVDDLAAARRRIVESADEQRRVLQAEIAAGPEAQLAISASALADSDPALTSEIAPLLDAIEDARIELERFGDGLGPALERDGLHGAIARLAGRSGIPVHVRVDVDLLPPAVEATVWFVCAEALTNALKHSAATVVHIVIVRDDGDVRVAVRDDGGGGADPAGTGLRGLADRVSALGGALTVTEAEGGGTLVSASIPVGGGER